MHNVVSVEGKCYLYLQYMYGFQIACMALHDIARQWFWQLFLIQGAKRRCHKITCRESQAATKASQNNFIDTVCFTLNSKDKAFCAGGLQAMKQRPASDAQLHPHSSTVNAAFQRGGCRAREHDAPIAQAAFHNPSSGRSLKSNLAFQAK